MDIHDIDIEYNALPMTAFLGRPYRTFLDGAALFPRVETRGYDVDRPCRDFLTRFTRRRCIDKAITFPGFPTPGKFFNN